MVVGLTLEYLEGLVNFSTTRLRVDQNLPEKFMTAIQRVAEEESARMVDKAYSSFVAELTSEFAAEKLPIS
jgi:hypothetical protein